MHTNPHLPPTIEAETWYADTERSVAYVILCGRNDRIINMISSMTYWVVHGAGQFVIGDSCVIDVAPGDSVNIPAGTQYQDSGEMGMLATAEPPFCADDVVILSN